MFRGEACPWFYPINKTRPSVCVCVCVKSKKNRGVSFKRGKGRERFSSTLREV